jgi:hypothetical protein
MLLRVVGAVAAGVMTVIGLLAVAKVSWGDNGFDASPVNVAGMAFTPEVAVATAVAGVIALLAAALWDVTSKLVVGTLLVVVGIVILLTDGSVNSNWTFENGQAWLAVIVGGVLIAVALLLGMVRTASSHVE